MKYKATRTLLVLAFVAALVTVARAPQAAQITQPASPDRVALYQALLDLQNPWTVMCVAAHPDDEDGTSLIVMRHKYGAHTVSLFSTFGEGGQNAIGPELYEELGAIRARETMAAAEIQGSEPHFLGLKDFGFSKTRDEAFKFWGHEEALRRMVLEIRKLRPDVIITNHSTTSNDHGQHQATALMVVEAFDAAADPTKFPEQLNSGVTPWQVQRLFVRARGNQQQPNAQIVTIDPNEQDPVRGVVYAAEALRALQQHATQGPWPKSFAEYANRFRAFSGQNAPSGQLPMIRYALVKSAKGASGLPTQASHNFLEGLQLPEQVAAESAVPALNGSLLDLSANREQAFAQLVEGFRRGSYGHVVARPVDPERRERMKDRIERAMALAAGIQLEVKPNKTTVIPGSTVNLSIKDLGPNAGAVRECSSWIPAQNSAGTNNSVRIPANAAINVPLSQHLYEPDALGLQVHTRCALDASGVRFNLDRDTRLDVAPPIEFQKITPALLVIVPGTRGNPQTFVVRLVNHRDTPFDGKLQTYNVTVPVHLSAQSAKEIEVRLPRNLPAQNETLTFNLSGSANETAKVPVFFANAQVAQNLSVGYIRGFDFSLPNALNALGVESKELSVDDVKTTDLSKFTSVIVDNRVYESKPELIAVNQKLLDYANAGGTLIVFYHKSDEWNPDERRSRPQLAPYKLILGGERVTDENAPITFIEPDHPLLNSPNKMGQDDFKDWIQERGLYYPREWDPQFHALLQSNDPGEQPLKGGLLVADYGKGHYIYTSMVWYRELRGGIPGAYRMLANMISYGRK
jgi:LmbE family N-acetylglucosaminyl deacetylase